jgi:hypothetical protein
MGKDNKNWVLKYICNQTSAVKYLLEVEVGGVGVSEGSEYFRSL